MRHTKKNKDYIYSKKWRDIMRGVFAIHEILDDMEILRLYLPISGDPFELDTDKFMEKELSMENILSEYSIKDRIEIMNVVNSGR